MTNLEKLKYIDFRQQMVQSTVGELPEIFKKINLNEQDSLGNTSLMTYYSKYSVKVRKEVIDYLIKNTDLNIKNKSGQNLLNILIEQKKETQLTQEMVDYIVESTDLSQVDSKNRTALMKLLDTPKNGFIEKNYASILKASSVEKEPNTTNALTLYLSNIDKENYIKLNPHELLDLTIKSGYSVRKKMPTDMVQSIMKYCATKKEEFNMNFWNHILNYMDSINTVKGDPWVGHNISVFQLTLYLGLDIHKGMQIALLSDSKHCRTNNTNLYYIKTHKIKVDYHLAMAMIHQQTHNVKENKQSLQELEERNLLLNYVKVISPFAFMNFNMNYFFAIIEQITKTIKKAFTSKDIEIKVESKTITSSNISKGNEKPYTFKKELEELSQNLSYCNELELNAENQHNVKELYPNLIKELKKQCVLDYTREQRNLPRDENLKETIVMLQENIGHIILQTLKDNDRETEVIKKQLSMKMGK